MEHRSFYTSKIKQNMRENIKINLSLTIILRICDLTNKLTGFDLKDLDV